MKLVKSSSKQYPGGDGARAQMNLPTSVPELNVKTWLAKVGIKQ